MSSCGAQYAKPFTHPFSLQGKFVPFTSTLALLFIGACHSCTSRFINHFFHSSLFAPHLELEQGKRLA